MRARVDVCVCTFATRRISLMIDSSGTSRRSIEDLHGERLFAVVRAGGGEHLLAGQLRARCYTTSHVRGQGARCEVRPDWSGGWSVVRWQDLVSAGLGGAAGCSRVKWAEPGDTSLMRKVVRGLRVGRKDGSVALANIVSAALRPSSARGCTVRRPETHPLDLLRN